jgi:hypothetical protein
MPTRPLLAVAASSASRQRSYRRNESALAQKTHFAVSMLAQSAAASNVGSVKSVIGGDEKGPRWKGLS